MRKQKMIKTVALSESWKNQIFANFLTNFYRNKSSFTMANCVFFLNTKLKLHFIVLRQAAEKSPKGAPPLDPGRDFAPQTCHGGLRPLDPLPPFRNVKFVMIRKWYYAAYARTQYNEAQFDFRFLEDIFALSLPISDKVLYVPRQSNCFYSDAVLP